MKKYRYVIVSSQGASLDISHGTAKLPGLFQKMWYADDQFQDLRDLMEKGWRPVRESGMGGGSAVAGAVVAFSLVLMEKDVAEPPLAEAAPS
jgi:hypothetical protein